MGEQDGKRKVQIKYSLDSEAPKMARDFFTAEEMASFKKTRKVKKKVSLWVCLMMMEGLHWNFIVVSLCGWNVPRSVSEGVPNQNWQIWRMRKRIPHLS